MFQGKAYARSIDNDNIDDRWTCPGCYYDLDATSEGEVTCPNCTRRLELSTVTKTSCRATLVESEPTDDD